MSDDITTKYGTINDLIRSLLSGCVCAFIGDGYCRCCMAAELIKKLETENELMRRFTSLEGITERLRSTQALEDEIERLRTELHKQSLKANIMRNVAMVPYGDSAGVIEELMADRDRWVEIAQLWDGAYSAQTYIHGLDEIETADMARKAQAKAVRGE